MDFDSGKAIRTQEQSQFFQLPREIRDLIYTALMSQTVPIKKYHREPRHCTGVILACKRLYEETIPVFYSTATFVIEENWARRGVEWLAALPEPHRNSLRTVIFKRDLHSLGNMYSKILYRASSEQRQQAMLLEPFLKELKDKGVTLNDGVLRV